MRMWLGVTAVLFMASNAPAQECDAFHGCTGGICRNGQCVGLLRSGAACDETNSCAPSDTCVSGVCRCVGDCDTSDHVSTNELMIGLNIALGRAMIEDCQALDFNHNGGVEVNELVAGVNSLMRDCAAAVARVVVDPPSVFLPGVGQETTLSAQALDSQGNPVTANITWTSSAPDQVSVGAN